jgi:hypothetical protein
LSLLLRVFIDGTGLDVPPGTTVLAAMHMHDAALAERVAGGTAYVTDARGIEVGPGDRLTAGSILRVVPRARRGGGTGDADA